MSTPRWTIKEQYTNDKGQLVTVWEGPNGQTRTESRDEERPQGSMHYVNTDEEAYVDENGILQFRKAEPEVRRFGKGTK